jgi:hypothetical protein
LRLRSPECYAGLRAARLPGRTGMRRWLYPLRSVITPTQRLFICLDSLRYPKDCTEAGSQWKEPNSEGVASAVPRRFGYRGMKIDPGKRRKAAKTLEKRMVGTPGLEPATSTVSRHLIFSAEKRAVWRYISECPMASHLIARKIVAMAQR